ncbi:hypothetical protein BS47DRAFT_1337094 [Hydnum rufescens UP504]|uniref:Uncharacterized protein n=1 Tax=Hydnum rufescens UP504 TaxID=1448309 RepID=A0A9P6B896_9AGAM|nr:hypothetical protein BS47DRAFT_1337094 [Hydnum rufescens UP504]
MSGDTQASFSASVRNTICSKYGHRCATCLNLLPEVSTQSAHVIDSASLESAVDLGLLSPNYLRSSPANGMALCADCHVGFFTPDLIALAPALPILQYILHYINHTPAANQIPMHEVFDLLSQAMEGADVALPDLDSVKPYLGLFTLVILRPSDVFGRCISTQHLPELSILQGDQFEIAPTGTSPVGENVARIFDVQAIAADPPPKSSGIIPLSPKDPEFKEQRYWRLPLGIGAVCAALIAYVALESYTSHEICCAQEIMAVLVLRRLQRGPSSGGTIGPSGAGSSGGGARLSGSHGGQHGSGPSGEKRSLARSDCQPGTKKGRKQGGSRDGFITKLWQSLSARGKQ